MPSRTFGAPEGSASNEGEYSSNSGPSMRTRLAGKISLSSIRSMRPSFSFARGGNNLASPSIPGTERPPIPTMMQSSGEVYSTPLPKLSMTVLSIVRFLHHNPHNRIDSILEDNACRILICKCLNTFSAVHGERWVYCGAFVHR